MMRTKQSWQVFWVVMLWLAVIGVRGWLVVQQEFWEDELWTLYFGITPPGFIEMLVHPPDDRPPLYHMFGRGLVGLGLQDNWLRLSSLVAGVATVWVLVRQIRKISPQLANLATLTLGSSLILIDASWQFREYAFLGLVAALQVSHWLSWLRQSERGQFPDARWWRVWALLSFFGVGLSYVYLPFLGALVLSCVIVFWWQWAEQRLPRSVLLQQIWGLLWSSVPAGLMAGVYLFAAQWSKIETTTTWITKPSVLSVTSLIATLTMWNNYLWEYRQPMPAEQQKLVFLTIFWVLCFGVTQWWLKRQRQVTWWWFNWWGFLVTWFNIGSVVVASHLFSLSVFLPRFFTPLATISAVMWALNLWVFDQMVQRSVRPILRVVGLLAYGFVFWSLFTHVYKIGTLSPPERLDLPKLTQTIREKYQPGDQLVFLPEHYQKIMPLFYFPPTEFPNAGAFFSYQQQFTRSVSATTNHQWSGKQLFIVVANLLIDPSSDFYAADGYQQQSLRQFQDLQQWCRGKLDQPFTGDNYSFFSCTLK